RVGIVPRVAAELAQELLLELLAALVLRQALPPGIERFGVVRAGDGERDLRELPHVARDAVVHFPTKHLGARDADVRQRLPHEIRHRTQILGEDLGLLAETAQDALTLLLLRR